MTRAVVVLCWTVVVFPSRRVAGAWSVLVILHASDARNRHEMCCRAGASSEFYAKSTIVSVFTTCAPAGGASTEFYSKFILVSNAYYSGCEFASESSDYGFPIFSLKKILFEFGDQIERKSQVLNSLFPVYTRSHYLE